MKNKKNRCTVLGHAPSHGLAAQPGPMAQPTWPAHASSAAWARLRWRGRHELASGFSAMWSAPRAPALCSAAAEQGGGDGDTPWRWVIDEVVEPDSGDRVHR
jgi:hypothetical protein